MNIVPFAGDKLSRSPLAPMRVAIVGSGLMGRWHARFARKVGAEIVAVVDCDSNAASRLSRRVGNPAIFADVGTMLRLAQPDAVHVCTPLPSHLDLIAEVLKAGVHVLAEKPLTVSTDEARLLLTDAEQHRVILCPVHQYGFQRGVAQAAATLDRLGEVLHVRFTICSAGGLGKDVAKLDDIVADILPHPLSVLQRLWPANRFNFMEWSASSLRRGELHVQGKTGQINVGIYMSMNARPTCFDLEILCAGGTVKLNFFHDYAVVHSGKVSKTTKVTQPFKFAIQEIATAACNLGGRALRFETAYPGLRPLISQFYAAVRGGMPNPITREEVLSEVELREHIIRIAFPKVISDFEKHDSIAAINR